MNMYQLGIFRRFLLLQNIFHFILVLQRAPPWLYLVFRHYACLSWLPISS